MEALIIQTWLSWICSDSSLVFSCLDKVSPFCHVFRHAHRGNPYVFGLAGADVDVDFPDPMPVIGILLELLMRMVLF